MALSRAGRQPRLNFLPYVFSLSSFVLVLFILLGGSTSTLVDLFYLKADTTNLDVPAKLANSTYLQDLSTVAGVDYTGQDGTASSLGLAQTYTVSLLSACAEGSVGTACSAPRVGFAFDPASDLQLDGTSLQGTYPSAFLSSLATYSHISTFLAIAYIASAALAVLAPVCALLGSRAPRLATAAAAASVIATLLLLAASVASLVAFTSLNSAFNIAFGPAGLASSLGDGLFALSWLAFLFSALASGIFVVRARDPASAMAGGRRGRGIRATRAVVAGKAGEAFMDTGDDDFTPDAAGQNGARKPSLWGRVPTWNRHQYVQVEKQPAVVRSEFKSEHEAVVSSEARGPAGEADADWSVEGDYAAGGGDGEGIAMRSLSRSPEGRAPMQYEPYRGAGM